MTALYNEIDTYAARWMQNLITAGHIAPGVVDTRSIKDVTPNDIRPYTQAHFFAGIAGWSHALRLAGWPDDRPVWTGSCPCQPFSSAGKRGGTDDARHLWPDWFRLIRECRPVTIFGEQVASKDGLAWLDLVYDDLESAGYAVAALDLCAAGIGAPHIRQRLYFVAHAESARRGIWNSNDERQADGEKHAPSNNNKTDILAHAEQRTSERHGYTLGTETGRSETNGEERKRLRYDAGNGGNPGNLGDTIQQGLEGHAGDGNGRDEPGWDDQEQGRYATAAGAWSDSRVAIPNINGDYPDGSREAQGVQTVDRTAESSTGEPSGTGGYWSELEWLQCRDGKARPTQPGLFPLANGVPARLGRLRAYGNAIVPPLAAEFIRACMEVLG